MNNIKTLFLTLLLLALTTTAAKAAAADDDTPHHGNFFTTQPAFEYGYITAAFADMTTTLDIETKHTADGKWTMEEKDPILGPHPSDAKVVSWLTQCTPIDSPAISNFLSEQLPPNLGSSALACSSQANLRMQPPSRAQ